MATPVIITVAITGALPRKKDNPAVPVTPAEQVESTHAAYEAGPEIQRGKVAGQQTVPDDEVGHDPVDQAG